jgi:hypothetical protein
MEQPASRLGTVTAFRRSSPAGSSGDAAMLETARFGLLIHHDDPDRDFAYDAGAEHALAEAAERGWTVVSIKHDCATVFGTESDRQAT